LGSNKKNTLIELKKITIKKETKQFTIHQSEINNYFEPNEFLRVSDGGSYITINKQESNYDPFIRPTPKLVKKLFKL
jgi:hypothetical protein